MSDKTVKISSEVCGQKECIVTYVDNNKNGDVKLNYNNKIKFENELGRDYPVSLYFYKKGDENDPAKAISDFCKNEASAPYVIQKNANCNMGKGKGEYYYSVEAEKDYEPLDPVIIIEDSNATLNPLVILVAVAVVAAVFGFQMFRRSRSAD